MENNIKSATIINCCCYWLVWVRNTHAYMYVRHLFGSCWDVKHSFIHLFIQLLLTGVYTMSFYNNRIIS